MILVIMLVIPDLLVAGCLGFMLCIVLLIGAYYVVGPGGKGKPTGGVK